VSVGALLPGPAGAAAFAAAVLVLNATPGVDLLLTLSRTWQGGARAGAAAALGINAGCVLHAILAAFGLAALLALHPLAFDGVRWLGAGYLAWIGASMLRQAWRAGPTRAAGRSDLPPRSWTADFRAGLLTNLLNPKVAFFFLAFLPQFVPPDSPGRTGSFLLLGAWFVLQSTAFLLLVVLLAAGLKPRWGGGRLQRVLSAVGGLLFIGLALRLLGSRPGSA
jgi:threonine/homoserine/homoserine lactone efflux protein